MKKIILLFLIILLGCNQVKYNKLQENINKIEEKININDSTDLINFTEVKVNTTINNTRITTNYIKINNCKPLLSIEQFNQICNSNINKTSTIELLSSYDVKKFCSTEFDIDLYTYAIINSISFVDYTYANKYFDNKKSSFFLKNLDKFNIENKNFIANSEDYINLINKNKYIKVNVVVLNKNNIIELIFNFEKNKGNFCSVDNIIKLVEEIIND